jgi:ABC-2 type transport system ATP-binding protein
VAILSKGSIIALDKPSVLKSGVGKFALECMGRHEMPRKFFQTREEAIDAGRTLCADITVRDVTLEDVFINLTGEKIEE